MDTAQIDTTLTFLATVARALEYAGAATFLLAAGYCALMHALAFVFVVVRAVLSFARGCTVHMLKHLRGVLDEVRAWPAALRAAVQSPSVNSDSKPERTTGSG